MDDRRTILIIGGGFGGTALAKRLARRPPAHHAPLLVSEESYTTFNPLLPEAVGASIFPEQVVAPIREIVAPGRGRFIMGRVTDIDRTRKTITCRSLAGALVLPYDQLVLAFGTRARLDLVPGMMQHALPLKTVGDAMHLRNEVLRRLARIELESDPVRRRCLGSFVVIGGGFSGVEVAGELIDCLASIRHFYPLVAPDEIAVTLLQDIDRLLPELPERLGAAAERSLAARGVAIRLGARAAEVSHEGVRLAAGDFVPAGTIVSTIGTRPNELVERAGLPVTRGRIEVAPDFRVRGHDGLWAIGDCALVPNAQDGGTAPPTAQFAVREAAILADNLRAHVAGRATSSFAYRSRGMMAAIGHRKGVALVFGIALSGLPAWLLWRAYYLAQMPTIRRKLRIFVEWSWGMFFPADITHLRFTRSIDLEAETTGEGPSYSSPNTEARRA